MRKEGSRRSRKAQSRLLSRARHPASALDPAWAVLDGLAGDGSGRDNDEGPRHEVTIARGFWLFDTPCTQALWQAVMGNNPSRSRAPTGRWSR